MTTSASGSFGPRLEQLKREIDHSLKDIRDHIQELDKAEKCTLSTGTREQPQIADTFSSVFNGILGKSDTDSD